MRIPRHKNGIKKKTNEIGKFKIDISAINACGKTDVHVNLGKIVY